MHKISVGATVSAAYKFAFARYFAILEVLWLPFLVLCVVGYFALAPAFGIYADIIQHAIQNPHDKTLPFQRLQEIQQLQARALLFDVLELAVISIISVGVVKEALGLRKGFRLAYVTYGLDELLVAGAYFLAWIMMVVFIIAAAIAGAIIVGLTALALHSGSGPGSWAAVGALAGLAGIVALCALVYLAVRFMFFIVPVTVAEREFGVFRSWELSRGNFWRIFAVLLLAWLPLLVALNLIWGAALWFTVIPAIWSVVRSAPAHSAATVFKALGDSLRANWPWMAVLYLIPLPAIYGLFLSPAAFAYRELKPAEAAPA